MSIMPQQPAPPQVARIPAIWQYRARRNYFDAMANEYTRIMVHRARLTETDRSRRRQFEVGKQYAHTAAEMIASDNPLERMVGEQAFQGWLYDYNAAIAQYAAGS